jgi:uncharacterized protein YbbC (DUF1343 family)
MQNRSLEKFISVCCYLVLIFSVNAYSRTDFNDLQKEVIIPGAAQFDQYIPLLKNKKVGLIVNHSSKINNTHLADTLLQLGINIKVIFAPEHGFRGDIDAGTKVENSIDQKTGIRIVSLYGAKFKPTAADLREVDMMVFDIQDVGVRFYTYISTLHYVMESCAENNIPLLVLDRPNPNGHYIDGPVLDTAFKSFVGIHPIPVVYGLTIAELAQMIKGERWINQSSKLNLHIVTCKNYTHNSRVKLAIRPSPNLPNELSILLYPSLCFFEGTNLSLGRGTPFPFQVIGHPGMKAKDKFSFRPISLVEAKNPPWKDSLCYGIDLRVLSIDSLYKEKRIRLDFLIMAYKNLNYSPDFFLQNRFFDKLAGTNILREQLIKRIPEKTIRQSWQKDIRIYKHKSKKYHLYK